MNRKVVSIQETNQAVFFKIESVIKDTHKAMVMFKLLQVKPELPKNGNQVMSARV